MDNIEPKVYLEALRTNGYAPNFWCSEEYMERAGWNVRRQYAHICVEDQEGKLVLPTVSLAVGALTDSSCWADLEGCPKELSRDTFLDHEYIYDPLNFRKMEGKQWASFRKNARKFPNRTKHDLVYRYPEEEDQDGILEILGNWAEGLGEGATLYDVDVMVQYAIEGEHRMVLASQSGSHIFGVNVWDSNWMYTNYRFCICPPGYFLSEYLRLLFYSDPTAHANALLVNDGGTLGSPGLKRFKDKLNPVKVRKVYTRTT